MRENLTYQLFERLNICEQRSRSSARLEKEVRLLLSLLRFTVQLQYLVDTMGNMCNFRGPLILHRSSNSGQVEKTQYIEDNNI